MNKNSIKGHLPLKHFIYLSSMQGANMTKMPTPGLYPLSGGRPVQNGPDLGGGQQPPWIENFWDPPEIDVPGTPPTIQPTQP